MLLLRFRIDRKSRKNLFLIQVNLYKFVANLMTLAH